MRHYYFYEDITPDSVKNLFNFAGNMEDDLTIYLNSQGGFISCSSALASFCNQHVDKITLIVSGIIYSAAFMWFFNSRCKRVITEYAHGMFHLPRNEILTLSNGNIENNELGRKDDLDQINENLMIFLRNLDLSLDIQEKLDSGQDVYFKAHDLRILLENQNEKLHN